ncbi:hypothetical protein J6590_040103 [Homalodisca vitripennis]|nr:hypothetical protein J6590_040103 [Homalodisca vitripennis]
MLSLLKSIQSQITEDNKMFKASFSSLEESMSNVQDSFPRNEKSILLKRVGDAEWSTIEQEQYSRMANIEIRDVPQTGDENLYAILEAISGALGVPFERQDISIAHRIPGPRDRRFHPAIVVQFARRTTGVDCPTRPCCSTARLESEPNHWPTPGVMTARCSFVRVTQDSRAIRGLDGLNDHLQTQPTPHNDTK